MKELKRPNKVKKISPEESKLMYPFQGKCEISQHWIHLDPDWIEDNFMTRDPESLIIIYPKRISGQTNKYWLHFIFHFVFQKIKIQFQFDSDTPIEAYQKNNQSSYFMSSLYSSFKSYNETVAKIQLQHA